MSASVVPSACPACGERLEAVKLQCPACHTEVQGRYQLCPVCQLDAESRKLFDLFLRARGNLKDVQRALGISYPTVRTRIEGLFQKLGQERARNQSAQILERLRLGEITVAEAEKLLTEP